MKNRILFYGAVFGIGYLLYRKYGKKETTSSFGGMKRSQKEDCGARIYRGSPVDQFGRWCNGAWRPESK